MESIVRTIDATTEVPQARRAKTGAASSQGAEQSGNLSFAETIIGIVDQANKQESGHTAHDPVTGTQRTKQKSNAKVQDILTLPDTDVDADGSANTTIPPLGQVGPQISAPETGAPQETPAQGTIPHDAVPVKSQSATQPTLSDSDLTDVADAADAPSTAQHSAAGNAKTVSTKSLMDGLASLGQTQEMVAEDSPLATLIATASNEAAAPSVATTPLQTELAKAQLTSAIDLALSPEATGPSALRALTAQIGEANGAKMNNLGLGFGTTSSAFNAPEMGTPNALTQTTPSSTPPAAAQLTIAGLGQGTSKPATKSETEKLAGLDAASATSTLGGSAEAPASQTSGSDTPLTQTPADTTPKPSQFQPHTVPMLAAAMMRRIQNGMKEFTLRLDPPELGRVDVRLTVDADKKVRAVVSTDRPEALKDLALSARDLTRALQEAGLDLEENGLSFSMNDQSSSQQNQERDQQQAMRVASGKDAYESTETQKPDAATPLKHTQSGPVERWQRARIALTA